MKVMVVIKELERSQPLVLLVVAFARSTSQRLPTTALPTLHHQTQALETLEKDSALAKPLQLGDELKYYFVMQVISVSALSFTM
jgi:hypothetical protein